MAKYKEMESAVLSLGTSITDRVCPYKDMGQQYNNGSPVFPFLYLLVFTDKLTKNKWYFSYTRDSAGNVFVYKMMYSRHVRENKDTKRSIVITESDIKRIVKETIKKLLNN